MDLVCSIRDSDCCFDVLESKMGQLSNVPLAIGFSIAVVIGVALVIVWIFPKNS